MATSYVQQSYSGTNSPVAFTSNGLSTGTPVRYAYVAVTNLDTTHSIFVSTITTSPAANTDYTMTIPPGQKLVIANELPYWTQAASVIQKGTISGGTPGTPAEIQPNGYSLYGQLASPGTTVYLNINSGTGGWSVEGTG